VDLLSVQLLTTAVAVSAIVLVQGAGVAQSVAASVQALRGPRATSSRRRRQRGRRFFRGLPVAARRPVALVSQRRCTHAGGGRPLGIAMLLVLAVFAPLVEFAAMPALAGLLVVAGVNNDPR